MDAGKKESKTLLLKLVIWLLILLSGGQLISQALYFQTYTDIVKNNPILSGDIKIPPFWRVIYDGARIQEMALIDSSGRLVEKKSQYLRRARQFSPDENLSFDAIAIRNFVPTRFAAGQFITQSDRWTVVLQSE